jgi:smad nuclear-interacting protein 1
LRVCASCFHKCLINIQFLFVTIDCSGYVLGGHQCDLHERLVSIDFAKFLPSRQLSMGSRRSRSPPRRDRRRSRSPARRSRSPPHRKEERSYSQPESQRYGIPQSPKNDELEVEKELPDFKTSGALVQDINSFNGVVLKYSEPPESRLPKMKYRLYCFKGKEQIDMLHVHKQSAYLFGRDRKVADIPIDHPSCSKVI